MLHGIAALKNPLVRCLCGWQYRIPDDERWGSQAAADRLLDAYLDHMAALKQRGIGES